MTTQQPNETQQAGRTETIYDFPKDELTIRQHEQDIRVAAGLPDFELNYKSVMCIKKAIKGLNADTMFPMPRNERCYACQLHYIWRNRHLIQEHAEIIQAKLQASGFGNSTGAPRQGDTPAAPTDEAPRDRSAFVSEDEPGTFGLDMDGWELNLDW